MHSSYDVCDMAGVSYRQLDYWCRNNVLDVIGGVASPGSGGQRRFTDREVRVAWAIGRLSRMGAEIPTLRFVGEMLRAMHDDEWHGPLYVSRTGAVSRQPLGLEHGGIGYCLQLDAVVPVAA